MRTDLWTLMRGGGGGSGGGIAAGDGRAAKRRPPPPPPPLPTTPSGYYSDALSSPSSAGDGSLRLRPDSVVLAVGPHGRPRGPPPPPPPPPAPPSGSPPSADVPADRSSLGLPRRSILVPESKEEEESADESGDEDRARPQRTRSRILGELRPVASPREAAEIASPLVVDPQPASFARLTLPDEDDEPEAAYAAADACGSPSAAASSARRRAFEVFASRRVRLQHRWLPDLWVFMKNAHPALAPFLAHRLHPFRTFDRVLVLLAALGAALLVSGIVATRPCCTSASDPSASDPSASASESESAALPVLPLSAGGSAPSTACACGLAHTSALVALAVAAVVPLVILLLEPLVTLYHDAKLLGCAVRARRARGASVPASGCCEYRPDGLAARAGRAFVLVLLLALAFALGAVAARLWDADEALDARAALLEWLVLFAAAAALGLLGLCSALWLALFAARWWREGRAAKADAAQAASVLVHHWPTPAPTPTQSPSHAPSPV